MLRLLKKFPSDDVAGETLQAVREMIQEYEALQARRKKVIEQIDALLAKIKDPGAGVPSGRCGRRLPPELSYDTLDRMAAFLQNIDDPAMPAEDKLALAVSGWLLGPAAATTKLTTALSAMRIRELARQYLNEPIKLNRVRLLHELPSEEAADADHAGRPVGPHEAPLRLARADIRGDAGLLRARGARPARGVAGPLLRAASAGLQPLPPLPDDRHPPRRRQHGRAADRLVGGRLGPRPAPARRHAHGYIVLAPEWTAEHQDNTAIPPASTPLVLGCYRDACRRFAVDTDRVFLSGHSMGGDAAWDIGLAHPDLWAGVIPIVAESDRFCILYWEERQEPPLLRHLRRTRRQQDGQQRQRPRPLSSGGGYNTTVVEYLGRGHEHFYDEMLRLFDWMGRFHRDFFPREFDCTTMREGDNFFWWVELGGMPPQTMVNPADWPPPRGTQPAQVTAKITAGNNLSITGPSRPS